MSHSQISTVVPTKSDSDVMLFYKVIRDLESINHLCINAQVISRFALAQVKCTR